LAFCFSLGDLGIIALFGSESFSTLPWYLYGLLGSYRTSDAAGVALVMLVLVLVVFVFVPRVFRRDDV
jgi:thiamine transport system permease protein